MEALGSLFILVGFAICVCALIAFVKPLPKLRLGTRKAAAAGLALSVGSCMVGGAIMPPQAAEDASPATVATGSATPANPPAKVSDPTGVSQAQLDALWTEVKGHLEPCDEQSKRLSSTLENDGIYEAYDVARRAKDSCRESWSRLSDMRPPSSAKGEAKNALQEAIDRCENAPLMKQIALEKFSKVLDGDQRPSAVSEAKEAMEGSQMAALGCAASFFDAAHKTNLTLPEMREATAKAD